MMSATDKIRRSVNKKDLIAVIDKYENELSIYQILCTLTRKKYFADKTKDAYHQPDSCLSVALSDMLNQKNEE